MEGTRAGILNSWLLLQHTDLDEVIRRQATDSVLEVRNVKKKNDRMEN